MPFKRATNCANAPCLVAVASSARYIISQLFGFVNPLFEIFFGFFQKNRPAGSEQKISKKRKKGVDFWHDIAYNNFRTKRNGELCNGSTYDSDSYCLGSNPSSPAKWLHGQAVKTSPSQGEIRGSIPLGAASNPSQKRRVFCFSKYCSRTDLHRAAYNEKGTRTTHRFGRGTRAKRRLREGIAAGFAVFFAKMPIKIKSNR